MCSRQSDPSRSIRAVFRGPLSRRAVCATAFLAAAAALVAAQAPATRTGTPIDISRYTVALDLDVDRGAITGKERIELTTRGRGRVLAFDSGALVVDSIRMEGTALSFAQEAPWLFVSLAEAAREGERRRLDITYHGAPGNGLTMLAARQQAYTTFSTSQWMVAVNAPLERATLDLEVAMPAGWLAAGNGQEVERRTRDGRTTYRWRHERETSSFLYGFVAGSFAESGTTHGKV